MYGYWDICMNRDRYNADKCMDRWINTQIKRQINVWIDGQTRGFDIDGQCTECTCRHNVLIIRFPKSYHIICAYVENIQRTYNKLPETQCNSM